MNIRMGKSRHVCMAQTYKGAKDENIPVHTRFIIGKLYVYYGLRFRGDQATTFSVFQLDKEARKRISRSPTVRVRCIGQQLQLLDRGNDTTGSILRARER